VAFSSDGLTLAVSGTSKDIQLWDVASHKILRTVTGHTKPVTSLAFSPDGNTLASSSADGTIRLWRVR
jgi:WD40 repeat protein